MGVRGAVLCIVGCQAAFLASTHQVPVALLPVVTIKSVSGHFQRSSGEQNHPGWEPLVQGLKLDSPGIH